MRVVYPMVTSMGFGNNVITLAKAYLIAESCALAYQRPLWPPTEHVAGEPRGYGYYLPWSAGDRLRVTAYSYLSRLQRKLAVPPWPPFVLFRREDYEQTRVTDVGESCHTHLAKTGLDDMKSTWSAATQSFNSGNVEDAVAKAKQVQAKGTEVMGLLGMKSGAT